MDKLKLFKERLIKNGYEIIVNWSTECDFGIIEHCHLKKGLHILPVIFQVDNDFQFELFTMSENNSYADDIKMLNNIFNK